MILISISMGKCNFFSVGFDLARGEFVGHCGEWRMGGKPGDGIAHSHVQ